MNLPITHLIITLPTGHTIHLMTHHYSLLISDFPHCSHLCSARNIHLMNLPITPLMNLENLTTGQNGPNHLVPTTHLMNLLITLPMNQENQTTGLNGLNHLVPTTHLMNLPITPLMNLENLIIGLNGQYLERTHGSLRHTDLTYNNYCKIK